MWAADSQVFVQRDPSSSTGQSIYNAGEGIGWMDVMHLGVVNLYTDNGERHLEYQGGTWVDSPGLSSYTLWGGPDLSAEGESHNADSSVSLVEESGGVNVYVNYGDDSYKKLNSSIIPLPARPSDTRCILKTQTSDSTTECVQYTDLGWLGWGDDYRAVTRAYSPHGDEAFIALTAYHEINKSSETWESCLGTGSTCLHMTFERVPDSTTVYAVKIPEGTTTKLFSVQDRVITRLGTSEDEAKEIFYYTEETHARIETRWWNFLQTTDLPSTSCAVEFRSRTASSAALTKSFDCDADYSGTLAPMRIARRGISPRP